MLYLCLESLFLSFLFEAVVVAVVVLMVGKPVDINQTWFHWVTDKAEGAAVTKWKLWATTCISFWKPRLITHYKGFSKGETDENLIQIV